VYGPDRREFRVSGAEGEAGDGPEVEQPSTVSDGATSKRDHRVRQDLESLRATRSWTTWAATLIAVVFGVALIDFVAQNTRDVRVEFFSASGHLPIAVALLAAALLGAVFVLAVAAVRVAQRRLHRRRRRRAQEASDVDTQPDPGSESR